MWFDYNIDSLLTEDTLKSINQDNKAIVKTLFGLIKKKMDIDLYNRFREYFLETEVFARIRDGKSMVEYEGLDGDNSNVGGSKENTNREIKPRN